MRSIKPAAKLLLAAFAVIASPVILAGPAFAQPATLTLSAFPQNSTGVPMTVEAVTNKVLTGTHLDINIFESSKLIATCNDSNCAASIYGGLTYPETVRVSADVGPAGARPWGPRAIVSRQIEVTLKFTKPPCSGSPCIPPCSGTTCT
jgi:hypothetical protein